MPRCCASRCVLLCSFVSSVSSSTQAVDVFALLSGGPHSSSLSPSSTACDQHTRWKPPKAHGSCAVTPLPLSSQDIMPRAFISSLESPPPSVSPPSSTSRPADNLADTDGERMVHVPVVASDDEQPQSTSEPVARYIHFSNTTKLCKRLRQTRHCHSPTQPRAVVWHLGYLISQQPGHRGCSHCYPFIHCTSVSRFCLL